MNNSTPTFTYCQLFSGALVIDPEYQRSLDMRRVRKIVAAFDENLVNLIKVNHRDGKYYVFDGQHTLAALKLRNGNADLMVNCKVYENLSREEEIRLFVSQNGCSRLVESIAKFRSLYAAGDVEVTEMVNLTAKSGFYVDFKKSAADKHVVAVTKLHMIFKKLSPAEYVDMLSILMSAWGGVKESVTTEMLGGMYLFYRTYKGRFYRPRLIETLSKSSPIVLVREGKAYMTGGDARFARQILTVYNKNTTSRRLPDDL